MGTCALLSEPLIAPTSAANPFHPTAATSTPQNAPRKIPSLRRQSSETAGCRPTAARAIVLRCYHFLPPSRSVAQVRRRKLCYEHNGQHSNCGHAHSGKCSRSLNLMSHKPVQARSNYNPASQRYPQTSPSACSTPDSIDCWGSFTPGGRSSPTEDMYATRLRH